jgi:ammonium transporter, Amt family
MDSGKFFADQVSADALLTSFFYIFSTLGVFLALMAIVIFDAGLVDKKNIIDTIIQKVVAAFVSGMAFMLIGYGIWVCEVYQAIGVPDPLMQAIRDWGLFGHNMNAYASTLDPSKVPEADLFQIFCIFFFMFAALTAAFVHSAGLERIKPSAMYIISVLIGGLIAPTLWYLTYSSTSFLTNNGMHDYVGIYSVYIFCGTWSVLMAWRLGPRIQKPVESNFALMSIGAVVLIVAIPALVIGNGFAVPGKGYFGITMNTSGLGIIFVNIIMSMGAGAIGGAIVAYGLSKPSYVFLGTIGGYISGTSMFDVVFPWQMIVVAFFAPFIIYLTMKALDALGIDDPKIGPLTLGTGIYGALVTGIVGRGIPTGGFFGVTSGEYKFQHSQISFLMQLEGVVVIVAGTVVTAFVILFILEKTIGLRVSAGEEKAGLDETYWSSETMVVSEA